MTGSISTFFRFLLLGSLALNILLGIAVLLPLLHHFARGGEALGFDSIQSELAHHPPPILFRHLPSDQRQVVKRVLDRRRGEIHAALADIREAQRELRRLLTAQNYDQTAAEAAFAALHDREIKAMKIMQSIQIELANQMEASGRAQLLEWFPRGQRGMNHIRRPTEK